MTIHQVLGEIVGEDGEDDRACLHNLQRSQAWWTYTHGSVVEFDAVKRDESHIQTQKDASEFHIPVNDHCHIQALKGNVEPIISFELPIPNPKGQVSCQLSNCPSECDGQLGCGQTYLHL